MVPKSWKKETEKEEEKEVGKRRIGEDEKGEKRKTEMCYTFVQQYTCTHMYMYDTIMQSSPVSYCYTGK